MHDATVYIVDDDEAVSRMLGEMVRSGGFAAETYPSAEEFLSRARPGPPCCLILDVRMPGSSGFDLQDRLAAAGVAIPIIFLTGFGSVAGSVRAMKAGAVDFLEKPVSYHVLLATVCKAIERSALESRERADIDEIRLRAETLTPRERQVFALVATGAPNKQIAAELGTSEITVKVHRSRVMRKMHAGSFADLVRMAQRLCINPVEA